MSVTAPPGGAIAAALCTIFALSAAIILGFVIYGYRSPESGVGQFMIRVCMCHHHVCILICNNNL